MIAFSGIYYQNKSGFTLIELIVVIVLIAIMATTVLPKFLTSSGFEEYTYRDELMIKLRAIQLRSMQQTNDSICKEINVTSKVIRLLKAGSPPNTCIDYPANDNTGDSTKVEIEDDDIQFSVSDNLPRFRFSSLGKPEAVGCSSTPCEITITVEGEMDLHVKINSEGYIYAP